MSSLFPLENLGLHCSWGKSWISLHLPEEDLVPSFHWRNPLETCPVIIREVCKVCHCATHIFGEPLSRYEPFVRMAVWWRRGKERKGEKGPYVTTRETFMPTDFMISFCNALFKIYLNTTILRQKIILIYNLPFTSKSFVDNYTSLISSSSYILHEKQNLQQQNKTILRNSMKKIISSTSLQQFDRIR